MSATPSTETAAPAAPPRARIPNEHDYTEASLEVADALGAVSNIASALQAGEVPVGDFERRPTKGDVGLLWSFCNNVRTDLRKLSRMVDELEHVLGELDEARVDSSVDYEERTSG